LTWNVTTKEDIVLDEGVVYAAIVKELKKVDTKFGERVLWSFAPTEYEDVTVPGFTSLSPSNKSKAAQWSRVILNIPKEQKTVNWGPEELEGKPCRVYVEVSEDSDGFERNIVAKVLPAKETKAEDPDADFSSIPF
jgi:hypothetical protein